MHITDSVICAVIVRIGAQQRMAYYQRRQYTINKATGVWLKISYSAGRCMHAVLHMTLFVLGSVCCGALWQGNISSGHNSTYMVVSICQIVMRD